MPSGRHGDAHLNQVVSGQFGRNHDGAVLAYLQATNAAAERHAEEPHDRPSVARGGGVLPPSRVPLSTALLSASRAARTSAAHPTALGSVSTSRDPGATAGLPASRNTGYASTRARAPNAAGRVLDGRVLRRAGPREPAMALISPGETSVLSQGVVGGVLHEHVRHRKPQRRRRALQPPLRVVQVGNGAVIDHLPLVISC